MLAWQVALSLFGVLAQCQEAPIGKVLPNELLLPDGLQAERDKSTAYHTKMEENVRVVRLME